MRDMSKHLTEQEYRDAVWDFILEHSDVTTRGAYFVKFHTSDRADFERRIRARGIWGYHRKDERTGETHLEKQERATELREAHVTRKKMKAEKWKADKETKRRALAEVKRQNELRIAWGGAYPIVYFVHKLYTSLTRYFLRDGS